MLMFLVLFIGFAEYLKSSLFLMNRFEFTFNFGFMEKKIALLIDCDNISFRTINSILKELEQYGSVIIKRAYGNWSSEQLRNWNDKLKELSIKPMHQIDYTKGKNATDMAIVIDAMELLHLRKVSAIAIVSSDSDFTPLVMKLLEEDLQVYGFGNSQTPLSLKKACSIFTDIQSFHIDEDKTENQEIINTKKISLKERVIEVFKKESPSNEYVTLEKINRLLKENEIDFKNHGFKQLKLFLNDFNVFNITFNDKNQGFLKLKKLNKG
jgi:uncharacterized protein (TIGR00288 family)